MILTVGEAGTFNDMVHLHLRTWQALAHKFERSLIPLCNIRPKHHYCQHLTLMVVRTRVNVLMHQNYNTETYLGTIKQIACKCHSASMMLRVQQRYLLLLALRWDRARRPASAVSQEDCLERLLLKDWAANHKRSFSATCEYPKRGLLAAAK